MALALDGPELEGQTSAQRVLGRDQLGTGQSGSMGQAAGPQAHQIGDEQKKPPAVRGEPARRQGELAHVGRRLDGGPRGMRPLLIQAPGQCRKTLGPEDFPHGGRAEGTVAIFERLADFIDRVVLFAQLDDPVVSGRLLGLGLRAAARGGKKDRGRLTAEMVAQDIKGIERVAKSAGDLPGGPSLDQEGAQGFVLAVFGQLGLEEKAAEAA